MVGRIAFILLFLLSTIILLLIAWLHPDRKGYQTTLVMLSIEIAMINFALGALLYGLAMDRFPKLKPIALAQIVVGFLFVIIFLVLGFYF